MSSSLECSLGGLLETHVADTLAQIEQTGFGGIYEGKLVTAQHGLKDAESKGILNPKTRRQIMHPLNLDFGNRTDEVFGAWEQAQQKKTANLSG